MILISNEQLVIYDRIILNEIDKNPDLNINQLSLQLKCSKTILISRIDHLIDNGYIAISCRKFTLTPAGKAMKISDEIFPYKNNYSINECDNKPDFDWHIVYTPKDDIFN